MKTKRLIPAIPLIFAAASLTYAEDIPLEKTIEQWATSCRKCHGEDGAGKTKAGRKLRVKDYTDPAVQAEMKDEDMLKIIAEGVYEKGEEKMQAYKDEYSQAEIKAFVAYIRSLQK